MTSLLWRLPGTRAAVGAGVLNLYVGGLVDERFGYDYAELLDAHRAFVEFGDLICLVALRLKPSICSHCLSAEFEAIATDDPKRRLLRAHQEKWSLTQRWRCN